MRPAGNLADGRLDRCAAGRRRRNLLRYAESPRRSRVAATCSRTADRPANGGARRERISCHGARYRDHRSSRSAQSAEELRAATAAELAEANSTIATLQDQQGSLEQQVATLQEELASTSDQAERLDQQRTALAGDVDRLQAALTAAETEREQAASALAVSEQDMAELRAELEQLRIAFAEADDIRGTAMAELAGARATIDTLRTEQARGRAAPRRP